MISGFDVVNVINVLLCMAILFIGCTGYIRTKNKLPFHIGIAFGLFAVSHLISFLGMRKDLGITVILIRICGYLIMLLATYNMSFKNNR